MATVMDALSLSQLLDLAIGVPQKGTIHFAAMRKLLQAMLGHLDVQYLTTQEPWTGELSGPSLAELATDVKEMKQQMESYKETVAEFAGIKAEHSRVTEDIRKFQEAQTMAVSKNLQEIETLKTAQSRVVQDMKKAQQERDQAMTDSQGLREEINRMKLTQSRMEEEILKMKHSLALMKKLEDDIKQLREDIAKWKEESSKQITQQIESVLQEMKSELKKMEEEQDMKNALLEQMLTETANQLNAQDQELLQQMEDAFSKIEEDCDELKCTSVSLQTDSQLKQRDIEMLSQSLEKMQKEKADEKKMLAAMDMKADKEDLGTKVDCTQFEESMKGVDEVTQDIQDQVSVQKQNLKEMKEKLGDMMENKLDRGELKYFRRRLEDTWTRNMEELEKRILGETAAGTRKQLPVPFTCLSCDRTVKSHVPGPYPETLPYLQPFPPSKELQHGQRRIVVDGRVPRVPQSSGDQQSHSRAMQHTQPCPRTSARLQTLMTVCNKLSMAQVLGSSDHTSQDQKDQLQVVAQDKPGPATSREPRSATTPGHVSWAPELVQTPQAPSAPTLQVRPGHPGHSERSLLRRHRSL